MRYKPKLKEDIKRPVAFLYAVVFQSVISMCVVGILFVSFLIQPIHQAYANSDEIPASETEVPVAAESVDFKKAESPSEANSPPSEEISPPSEYEGDKANASELGAEDLNGASVDESNSQPETDVSTASSNVDESSLSSQTLDREQKSVNQLVSAQFSSGEENTPSSTVSHQTASSGVSTGAINHPPNATSTINSSSTPTTSESYDAASSTMLADTVPADFENIADVPNTASTSASQDTPHAPSQEELDAAQPLSTSTDESQQPAQTDETLNQSLEQAEIITKVESLVTDDNFYQFNKQSCVSVGAGAYHCSINDEPIIDTQSVVMSEIGENGNTEIFIRTAKGNIEQITDNEYDDSAPHYDPDSQRIVWQRLINDRYQVILYEIAERKETQLTFSRTNNMEPAVSSAGVVWQAWDNNDWEIMFFDGELTDQLTNNETQDLAPVLEDEYVIWTVIGDGSQYAQVYSLDSGEIMTITNYEGGSIVNPRFVLVYDTQFDNGDIITQGFDPKTGFAEPLSATPAPEPIDLPDPEPFGEIKALIQNKSSSKDKSGLQLDDESLPDIGLTPSTSLKIATSSDDVLDLKSASTTQVLNEDVAGGHSNSESDLASTTQEFIELDEFDLVIPFDDALSPEDDTVLTGATSSPTHTASSTSN